MDLCFPCEMKEVPKVNVARTISHLGFNCKDIDKSVAFYRDILGFAEKFTLTYNDMADQMTQEALAAGKKPRFLIKAMRRMGQKTWLTYMSWSENSFIELFSIPAARRKRVPDPKNDLNYTHFSLEVSDLKLFREQALSRGGAPYIDTEIQMGVDNTWQMWLHDPDGNPFEVMEYTPQSYQITGR